MLLLLLLLPLRGGLQAVGAVQRAVLHASDKKGDGVDAAHAAMEQQPCHMVRAGWLCVTELVAAATEEETGEMKEP